MFRGRIYFFIALIGIFTFLLVDYSIHKKVLVVKGVYNNTNSIAMSGESNLNSENDEQARAVRVEALSIESFKKEFSREVLEVGRLQSEPDRVEERLQALAKQLNIEQMDYLFNVMMNSEINGDDRSLAVELMSLNTSVEAHLRLKNFIAHENFSFKDRIDFEIALRAQAIEGLLNCSDKNVVVSSLNELKGNTKYSLLSDREERALAYINGTAPSLQDQDNAALKKLITK